jgi:hypothetical protein
VHKISTYIHKNGKRKKRKKKEKGFSVSRAGGFQPSTGVRARGAAGELAQTAHE